LLFEPENKLMEPYGVHSHESVVTASEQGEILLAIENYHEVTVHLELGV